MGSTTSKEHLSPEEKAAAEAKHAQVGVMKQSLMKKVEEHEDRLKEMKGGAGDPHLATFKTEMLAVVDEHMEEYAKMEKEQEQLAVFKKELMEKVHEHMDEINQAEAKAADVAKFKDEMIQKVDAHVKAVSAK